MSRDHHDHKLPGRRPFRDVPHVKLTDIFKSLRRRRLRRDVSQRSSLTHSRTFPPPIADHDSPAVKPPLPDLSTSSFVRYRSDAVSILSTTEEDCSSGMSNSSSGLEGTFPGAPRGRHISPRPISTFPTSPSIFQLRSTSSEDYLVDRLELHLRQLNLGDHSPNHIVALESSSLRVNPTDVHLDVPPPLVINPKTNSNRAPSHRNAHKPTSASHDQNVVPTILVTSVDAKHAKPLPPSSQRPSRTPFSPSNVINNLANVPSTKSKRKAPDDPFATQSHGLVYPPDYNLTFQLPSFPSSYPTPSKYAPETPTPMYCDHPGDCRGDLWEVLHPPLVASRFTLPPFKLPPLGTDLFNDASIMLSY